MLLLLREKTGVSLASAFILVHYVDCQLPILNYLKGKF